MKIRGGGHLESAGSPKGLYAVSGWHCTSCTHLLVVQQSGMQEAHSGKQEAHCLLLYQCPHLQVLGLDLWQLSYCYRAAGNRLAKETVPTYPSDPESEEPLALCRKEQKVKKFLLPCLSYHRVNEKCIL